MRGYRSPNEYRQMTRQLDSRLYLTAKEAASELNISVPSLYAYVSRGLIKSQSISTSRKKGYLRSDVKALKNKQRGAKGDPNFFFTPELKEDKITTITESGPTYRGHDSIALARTESLETLAGLLWQSEPTVFCSSKPPIVPKQLGALRQRYKALNPLHQYIAMYPLIEQSNPKSYNLTGERVARTSAEVIRWLSSFVADSDEYPDEPIHKFIARKRGVNEGYAELFRAFLVLLADHEQGPASLAAKNTAYAGNTPYGSVASGLITWQGAYVLKGVVQPPIDFINEIMTKSDPAARIVRSLQQGMPLPGFEHPIYGGRDPRGALLLELTREYLPDDEDASKFCRAAEIAEELTERSPSAILVAAFLAYKFGMPNQIRALIAVARSVGWLGHAIEIYKTNKPFSRNA